MRKNKQSDVIKQLSKRELTFHLYITQVIILTISIISSIFLFHDYQSFFHLFKVNSSILSLGVVSGIIIVILDLILMRVLPQHYYDDGGVNEKIFKDRSFLEILFLAAVIALSEELLFRGVIQTNFGMVIASIVFAIAHIRYWGHWFLIVNIVVLSFWMGLVYEFSDHNVVTTIVMHFIVDFLLGLSIKYNNKTIK